MLMQILDVPKTTQTLFSEEQLTQFDGTHERFGVYLAVRVVICYARSLNHSSY